jgi:hypothetical protein
VHDFYKRKSFLQSVAAANAAVKADMEAELQAALSIKQQEAQAAAKQNFDTQVRSRALTAGLALWWALAILAVAWVALPRHVAGSFKYVPVIVVLAR